MKPRLWVIDPSINRAEDQGVAAILRGWDGESRIFRPVLSPGEGPEPATGYDTDGVVLMGSAASVHDDHEWLARLTGWLRPIVEGRIGMPLLGICFGHQLIAHLAGAEIAFLNDDRSKRLGVERSKLTGSRLLTAERALRVVVSHREHVASRPAGYRVVASRPGVTIDGLEHEKLPIFSFQFHPEAGEEFAGHVGVDPALLDVEQQGDSQLLLGTFRDLVRASSAA
jgi:GMP synthase-like glutamine amidotransferase